MKTINCETIRNELTESSDEIRRLREDIHSHPELGNNEFRTADLIESYLNSLDITTKRVLGTAVIGTLRGKTGGRTVALRADMDALPLTEITGADFASVYAGKMHACGHDVHTAALLGAARILSAHRDELEGNVVFLFEPDEEGRGGAARMIKEGCLEGADAVFGAHVTPDLPSGKIGVMYGKFYAASDTFRIVVNGRASHGAVREKGIDALAAAAEMVTALLALPGQITDDKCVLTVGKMNSGTAENIMPGFAELEGIIRTLGSETRAAMEEAFHRTVREIAGKTGTTVVIEYNHSHPGIVNNDEMTALAEKAATDLFGDEGVCRIDGPTMTTEDFGCFLNEAPGTFYHIGAGCEEPLHSSTFLPDDDVAIKLGGMHAAVVLRYLNKIKPLIEEVSGETAVIDL